MNKILNLIYSTHNEGKEKIVFLRDFILKHDGSCFTNDIRNTLKFFYKHIPLHFAYEEVVINALLKSNLLTKEETSSMNKILDEHIILKSNFEKLNVLSGKMYKACTKEQQEDFLCLVNKTVEDLIKHAEYEDQYFYPIANTKVNDALLSSIEKEISRIVY